jgi:UDP-hydrolysing UDP-N-acetyl-D-glucosamine 2-epimerase
MNNKRRKICVVLVDRANYGRLKPVMIAIKAHPELQLQVLAAGTMVLERFHQPVEVVRKDGFSVDGEVYLELEGSTPGTMAKSVGFGIVEFASEFQRLKPDVIVLIGDRYEALSAAIAAAYMNICIAHIQGGEVSGSIDESARHAISKFAHFHFPSTERSAIYLTRMGENPATILSVGCPSSDIARQLDTTIPPEPINTTGSGAKIEVSQPFILVVFHPITTEYGGERGQMEELFQALDRFRTQTILLWPNIDAGADHISKAVRIFRDLNKPSWLRILTNLDPELYLKVLARAVVLVGKRQEGREIEQHVRPVEPVAAQIITAIEAQLAHGRYAPSPLYGDGYVSGRIAEALAQLTPYVQKRLHYIYDDEVKVHSVFPNFEMAMTCESQARET